MTTVVPLSDREATIRAILDDLLTQRRRMESAGERGLVEANRLAIVYWEWQLSRCAADERTRRRAVA
jgi:hypothetical protein